MTLGRIHLLEHNLEASGLPEGGSYHLVTVSRYLYRPHFPHLAQMIAPGGFLVFHTFMKGSELTAVGRPRRPQFLLNENELSSQFNPSSGFRIIKIGRAHV